MRRCPIASSPCCVETSLYKSVIIVYIRLDSVNALVLGHINLEKAMSTLKNSLVQFTIIASSFQNIAE